MDSQQTQFCKDALEINNVDMKYIESKKQNFLFCDITTIHGQKERVTLGALCMRNPDVVKNYIISNYQKLTRDETLITLLRSNWEEKSRRETWSQLLESITKVHSGLNENLYEESAFQIERIRDLEMKNSASNDIILFQGEQIRQLGLELTTIRQQFSELQTLYNNLVEQHTAENEAQADSCKKYIVAADRTLETINMFRQTLDVWENTFTEISNQLDDHVGNIYFKKNLME